MTSPSYAHHFSIHNLPFGIASSERHAAPKCVTRLENTVIFLDILQKAGYFNSVRSLPGGIFDAETLNAYASLPREIQRAVRMIMQSILSENGVSSLPAESIEGSADVRMYLPISIPAFTDFSCSKHHVQNAGMAILNNPAVPPGFPYFPIGYTGRADSIVVSGTPIPRPSGHFYDRSIQIDPSSGSKPPVRFGPSREMDYELEIGVVIGPPVERGRRLSAEEAEEHIFGLVILNDWSARDIQGLEMNPLGPLNGKSFATSISPWIITLDAVKPFKVPGPAPETALPAHLQDPGNSHYSIDTKVELQIGDRATVVTKSQARDLHWSASQMCAHLASSGCGLQTGEVLGTGTVSGPTDRELGCLLEVTKGGKTPLSLNDGDKRIWLEDGDVVRMTAVTGDGIGFGECVGKLVSEDAQ